MRCDNDDSIVLVARLHIANITLVQRRLFDSNPALAWKCIASFECHENLQQHAGGFHRHTCVHAVVGGGGRRWWW